MESTDYVMLNTTQDTDESLYTKLDIANQERNPTWIINEKIRENNISIQKIQ